MDDREPYEEEEWEFYDAELYVCDTCESEDCEDCIFQEDDIDYMEDYCDTCNADSCDGCMYLGSTP